MSLPSSADLSLLEQLNAHPILKARIQGLLNVAENTSGDSVNADAVEQHLIEEVRRMGQELLQDWADGRVEQSTEQALSDPAVQRRGKKSTPLA